jgi:hypothetical protein
MSMAMPSSASPGCSSPESFEVEEDQSSAHWQQGLGQTSPSSTSQPRASAPLQKRRRVTRACDEWCVFLLYISLPDFYENCVLKCTPKHTPSLPSKLIFLTLSRRCKTNFETICSRRKKIKCDGKQPCTHCTVYSYGMSALNLQISKFCFVIGLKLANTSTDCTVRILGFILPTKQFMVFKAFSTVLAMRKELMLTSGS